MHWLILIIGYNKFFIFINIVTSRIPMYLKKYFTKIIIHYFLFQVALVFGRHVSLVPRRQRKFQRTGAITWFCDFCCRDIFVCNVISIYFFQLIEKKFLSGMYDMFFYSYSNFQRILSISSQIISHKVSVALAVELRVSR